MTSYVLNYASGATHEINAESDDEAIRIATDLLGDDVVVCDQWDAASDGVDDEGDMERLLFWASEEDAENDSGAKAIAQLEALANRD